MTTVLVTGASGLLGGALSRALAGAGRTVFGVARFTEPGSAASLDRAGVRPVAADLATLNPADLPDVDEVYHCGAMLPAHGSERRPAETFEVNVQATGRLMSRYRAARAFVHCSTASVYADHGDEPIPESGRLGLHNGLEVYAASKLASESVVSFASREFGLAAIQLRIFSLYGPTGGPITARVLRALDTGAVPVHPGRRNLTAPIFLDDAVELLPVAADAAEVGAPVVNFCGAEVTSVPEYCALAAEFAGTTVEFFPDADAPYPLLPDPSVMFARVGRSRTTIAEGVRRILAARGPSDD